jgi:hypothetical protein
MKYLLMILILVSQPAYAVDFQKYITLMKKEMNRILGDKKNTQEMKLPNIPTVSQAATSTDVYHRQGKLYTQGDSFNRLSDTEKRNYRVAFLKELYVTVRGAEATTQELVRGVNVLEQGGSREGVYRSLVLSNNYMSLETYEEAPNEKLVGFSMKFGVKYLALNFDKNQIEKLNVWSIKRVVVEKTLDVLDAFSGDGEDLYKWYAILSTELSSNFPAVWKGRARLSKDASFHLAWAKKVPFQQVKSEVIIKLHKLMNSL